MAIAVIMFVAILLPVICSLKEEDGEDEETEGKMGKEGKDSHRESAAELAGGTGKEEEDNDHLYTE